MSTENTAAQAVLFTRIIRFSQLLLELFVRGELRFSVIYYELVS